MQIILYNNTSENYRLNKNITQIADLQGYLREGSNLLAPEIKIEFNDPSSFNYCYIPEFKRYYYVKDVIIENTNVLTIVLNVDVLMSFKDQLLKLSGLVLRQEYNFNEYLDDSNITVETQPQIYVKTFPKSGFFTNHLNNILIVAGGYDTTVLPPEEVIENGVQSESTTTEQSESSLAKSE